jgi:hypothetical protein
MLGCEKVTHVYRQIQMGEEAHNHVTHLFLYVVSVLRAYFPIIKARNNKVDKMIKRAEKGIRL